jgi:tripartite-type tricarboxylate transporter receptor subunit TctC
MIQVVSSPDLQRSLTVEGVDPEPGSPAAVTATIAADIVKWRGVVAAAHITVSQ